MQVARDANELGLARGLPTKDCDEGIQCGLE